MIATLSYFPLSLSLSFTHKHTQTQTHKYMLALLVVIKRDKPSFPFVSFSLWSLLPIHKFNFYFSPPHAIFLLYFFSHERNKKETEREGLSIIDR